MCFFLSVPDVVINSLPDAPVKWSAYSLCVDDWCDAQDNVSNWCVAQVCSFRSFRCDLMPVLGTGGVQVVAADISTVRVHFKGWASKWDETLSRASNKLAELGTHTSGKDTGWGKRQQGVQCKYTGADFSAIGDKLRQWNVSEGGAGSLSPTLQTTATTARGGSTAFEIFWRDEVVDAVDCLLTSSFTENTDIPIANNFLREVIDALVKSFKEKQFNKGKLQLLNRILLLDE
jgi:hypothetical protein